jgi:hypothetical protein
MQREPQRLIVRFLEFAALFALSAFLIRLGLMWLAEVRPVIVCIGAATLAVVGLRLWLNRPKW